MIHIVLINDQYIYIYMYISFISTINCTLYVYTIVIYDHLSSLSHSSLLSHVSWFNYWLLLAVSSQQPVFFSPGFSPLCKHQHTDGKMTSIDWTWLFKASIIPVSIMFHKPKHHSVNAFWSIKLRSVHGLNYSNYRNNSQLHWSSCRCGCKKNLQRPKHHLSGSRFLWCSQCVFHLNLHVSCVVNI